ncbi:hypothetical protein [Haladaptatus sp. DYF46]|uniref:hypothetical protein n=1 Tax=Haladaptatus sp. DYF46 TaxID=2886041 RepID=UPI001E3CB327|nr:hypothetical protein [Haladaptatus sp. DYF46]
MEINLESFSVECTECDMDEDADDYSSLEKFSRKHVEHTGHDIRWVQGSAVPEVSVSESTDYRLRCETCNESWSFDSQYEAEEFQSDHAEYTDHEAVGEIETEESWTAHCGDCRTTQEFATQSEANEWRDEHRTKDHRTGIRTVFGTIREQQTESAQSEPSLVETGHSKSQRDRIKNIKELISKLEDECEDGAPVPFILIEAEMVGMTQSKAQTELEKLKQKGEVYEPSSGFVRTT